MKISIRYIPLFLLTSRAILIFLSLDLVLCLSSESKTVIELSCAGFSLSALKNKQVSFNQNCNL